MKPLNCIDAFKPPIIASIMLEECSLDYNTHALALGKSEQKQDWFLQINPNGRIPAIVDHDNDNFEVFESGAILIYLAEKTGRFLPPNASETPNNRSRVIQWLLEVLDTRLADNEYLAGAYSIADIANFSWARTAGWSGVESQDLENLSRWIEAIQARPAVQRGLEVPAKGQLGKTDDEFVKSVQKMVT